MNLKNGHDTIAIFTGYFLPFLGGIERYTDKLTEELNKRNCRIIIITSNHEQLASIEESNGRRIYRLPVYSMFKNRYPIPKRNDEYRRLIKLIKEEGIDYYICNTRFQLTTFIGARLANKANKQAIIVEHGSSHFTVGNQAIDFLGKIYEHILAILLKRYVKDFYGVSARCNEWLKHFNIKASGIFYNAVDSDAYATFRKSSYLPEGAQKYQTVITYAGRVMKEKGVEMLLESFSGLSSKHNSTCLVIAGDGPYLNDARKRFTQENIYFSGKLDYAQVMGLFNRTDIFCYPSMYPEGLPTSILEAGIMGCAVVATDRGGTKEVINDVNLGIIIDETEKSLSEALNRLLNDGRLTKRLGDELHKRVYSSFTWTATASRVQQALMEGYNEQ